MVLSTQARDNLSVLINDPAVKRISVSGEGEPLNNIHTFYELLALSRGGNSFEFITSGFFRHEKMEKIFDEINRLVFANGDTCNIRLSSDSHHIEKVKWRAHGFSLDYVQRKKPSALSFSFRSIDTDRAFTREYLVNELASWGINATIKPVSVLEDKLLIGADTFNIDYKNLVHPSKDAPKGYLDFQGYIAAIESKVNKPFTFGSLNLAPQLNGMDVTIKPNGDVFLYGIETDRVANIHSDMIDWHRLATHVRENSLSHALYTQPLTELLTRLENTPQLRTIIATANNPYWLVKEMAKHSGLLEQWKAA